MIQSLQSYEAIKRLRDHHIMGYAQDYEQLNTFHDFLMRSIVGIAIQRTKQQWGNVPLSPFSFFVMGSAGRSEQGIRSDQDHGLVYLPLQRGDSIRFVQLGREITEGMHIVGYKKCEGNVMASNPLWCQSITDWAKQLQYWMEEASWEAIRYLLIVADARVLVGQPEHIAPLKNIVFYKARKSPELFQRMVQNTAFLRKGVGIFNQLLPQVTGTYTGAINMKETAFFPFANGMRLLAIQHAVHNTSTLDRFEQLRMVESLNKKLKPYQIAFQRLLRLRAAYQLRLPPQTYEDHHYIQISTLTSMEKKELKRILVLAASLHKQLPTLLDTR